MPGHPSLYVREEPLLDAIAGHLADRVFGADRRTHLAAQHRNLPREHAAQHTRAIDATRTKIEKITAKQDALMAELEELDPIDTSLKTYRARIRERFTDLETDRVTATEHHAELVASQPAINTDNPDLLDTLPIGATDIRNLPADVQERLFDALQLTVRIDNSRQAHIKVTLTVDTADNIPATATTATGLPTGDTTMINNQTSTAAKLGDALPWRNIPTSSKDRCPGP